MYKSLREEIKQYIKSNPECTWTELFKKFGKYHRNEKDFIGQVMSWGTVNLTNNKYLNSTSYIPRNHNW